MSTAAAEALRARARSIRRTAALVEQCEATRLVDRAGDDTWIGPTPRRCQEDLVVHRSALRDVHHELTAAAQRLDVQADLVAAGAVASAGGTRATVS